MPRNLPTDESDHEVHYRHDRNGNIKVDPLSLLTDPEFLKQVEAANKMAAQAAAAVQRAARDAAATLKAAAEAPKIDPSIESMMDEIRQLRKRIEELQGKLPDDAA